MSTLQPFKDSEKLSKNVYFLASSATQKCIRRGCALQAVNFAKVMWRLDPYGTAKRAWIWLSEDCCRNVEALRAFYNWRMDSKNFEGIAKVVALMAQGPKDRTGANLSFILRGININPIRIWSILRGDRVHGRVLDLMKWWEDRKYQCYDAFTYRWDDHDFEWIIDLAERGDKFDREGFITAIPYFFSKETYESYSDNPVVECDSGTWYKDWFPLEAMDGHTRPGMSAFGIFCKHRDLSPIQVTNSYGLKPYVFFNEGCLSTKYVQYSLDFTQIFGEGCLAPSTTKVRSGFWTDEVREYMKKEVIPELNNVREWVIGRTILDEMKAFHKVYKSDWVSFRAEGVDDE